MIKLRKIVKGKLALPRKGQSKPKMSIDKEFFYYYQLPCYLARILFLFNAFGDVIYFHEKGYM